MKMLLKVKQFRGHLYMMSIAYFIMVNAGTRANFTFFAVIC